LQDLTIRSSAKTTYIPGRSVTLLVNSCVFNLSGEWDWDLQSENIFCSDVILSKPFEFLGTRAILHPDDKESISDIVFTQTQWEGFSFRVITTYGEIKTLKGRKINIQERQEEWRPVEEGIIREAEEEKQYQHLHLLNEIYRLSEKDTDTGTWYYNVNTHSTWYSSQVFRIFELPPNSLNPHLNTFKSYIHPEDHVIVSEYLDLSYKNRTSIQITYRIVTAGGEKTIRQMMNWTFSQKGEEIWCGTYQDITVQLQIENQAEETLHIAEFHKQLLLLDEQQANMGHWHINLLTKKTHFSKNLYRLFGVKPNITIPSLSSLANFIHPEDREQFELSCRKNEGVDMDFRIIRSDGKLRYISQRSKLMNFGGELVMGGLMQDVTVQKLLEKRIAFITEADIVSLATQRAEEELSRSGSMVWDIKTGKIQWSDQFYKLLGIKQNEKGFTIKQLMIFIHPEDQKTFTDELAIVTEHKKQSDFLFRLIKKGGSKKMMASFSYLETTKRQYVIGVLHDVSKEEELSLQLNQRIQMAEALIENIKDRVIITDADNNILLWNKPCEDAYGIKRSQALKQNFFDVFPKLKVEDELEYFKKVFEGETIRLTEIKSVVHKGYFNQQMIPLWNEGNKEVVGIIHIAQDITREFELKKSLGDRLSFIESIVESSVDQIIAFDHNMNYLLWNRECENYYGLKKEQVIGKNMLEIFPDARKTPAYEDFRKALRGETVHIPAKPEYGMENFHEIYLIPVKDHKEAIIAVLWVLHDLRKEFELNSQETRINTLLNSLNEGFFELDREFRFITINPAAADFYIKKREDLISRVFTDLFPQALGSSIYKAMCRVMDERVTVKGEYFSAICSKWIYASFTPTDKGIAVLFFDIQNIKEAEISVKENEYLLQQINKATPDAITIYNLDLKQPIYLNNSLSEWTGYSNEELINMGRDGRLQLIHPDDRPGLIAFNKELEKLEDKEIKSIDYRLITSKGEHWIRNRSKVFKRDPNGKVYQTLSVLQDVSKEIELLKRLDERTRYAEKIIDASIDQVVVVDTEFKIIAWNDEAENRTGLSRSSVIGKNIYSIFPELKEDHDMADAFAEALKGNLIRFSARQTNSSSEFFEYNLIPLTHADGKVYAVLYMTHDVSDIVSQSEELIDLNKTLETKNRELEQKHDEITSFSFIASHDLKEPLRKIHTFADWILENESENFSNAGKNFLDKLQVSIKRMERLIEDILVLMKINNNQEENTDVDLNEILDSILSDISDQIEEKHAVITSAELPVVKGNQNQLFYLFRNLIINALKFQDDGNIPKVNITSIIEDKPGSPGEQYWKISFTDNGIGFNKKYSKKIFMVFQRLHNKNQFDGTGIGLAMCKKIMENHHGIIRVESEERKGSVFHCYFPIN
jgi:PAS domain S-box-containing protein